MSKTICYEDNFKCPSCQFQFKKYVWSDRKNNPFCTNCKKIEMEIVIESANESFTIINGKYKNGRDKKEAIKRSQDHFKKEIMPTLKESDRKYYEKKYGKQK